MNFTFQPRPADLWSVFEHAFATGRGNVIKDFRFIPGTTPMSTFSTTLCALLTYYAVILGGRELMRTHEPFKLGIIFQAHNLFLSVLSGVLLLLFVEELVPTLYSKGVFHTICRHDGGWTDRLVVLYYVGEPFSQESAFSLTAEYSLTISLSTLNCSIQASWS